MKKLILALIIGLASCTGNSFHNSSPDTSVTVLLYLTPSLIPRVDLSYRIIKDTFVFDSVNAETAKKVWKRDTAYFIPVQTVKKDSLGNVLKDSAGNVKVDTRIEPLLNKDFILQDYNKKIKP